MPNFPVIHGSAVDRFHVIGRGPWPITDTRRGLLHVYLGTFNLQGLLVLRKVTILSIFCILQMARAGFTLSISWL